MNHYTGDLRDTCMVCGQPQYSDDEPKLDVTVVHRRQAYEGHELSHQDLLDLIDDARQRGKVVTIEVYLDDDEGARG